MFAYKVDGVQREQDPKFSFFNVVGTASETDRKVIRDNWLHWWSVYENDYSRIPITGNVNTWKMYSNTKYGFSFRYPQLLDATEHSPVGESVTVTNLQALNTRGSGIVFSVVKGDMFETKTTGGNPDLQDSGVINIGGYNAKKFLRPINPATSTIGSIIYYIPEKNISIRYYFYPTYDHKITESEMNNILSGFQFTK